ncbi:MULTISPECIES: hypothetical protein [unclassified Kitasatospora]|uniref:hypothetical protein n=1 Tax=unclassified Kitasatospora TaxID=2633591 RepID=UPI0034001B15
MIDRAPLPPGLRPLFPAGSAERSTLSMPLPPGRLIVPACGDDSAPVMWLSSGMAPASSKSASTSCD